MADVLARHAWFGTAILAITASLAACSGATSSGVVPSAHGGSPQNPLKKSAHFVIKIPPKKTASKHNKHYVSPGTASMTVVVKGGATQTFNLTPSSSGCTTNRSTGYLTCQEAMSIASGEQTLTVTLFNLENGQGSALATATTSVNVAAVGFTDIPITLGGIISYVQVLINGTAPTSIPMGTPTSLPVTVEAYDASGSLIVAPGSYSSQITLSNSDTSGATSFTPPSPESVRKLGAINASETTERRFKPLDTAVITTPGASATLYYSGNY